MMLDRYDIEKQESWREWINKVPYLQFPANWDVKVIPPFAGALVRFVVKKINSEENISVYLDVNDSLGCMSRPYWEIYPAANGDTERFYLDETKEMIAAIAKSRRKK